MNDQLVGLYYSLGFLTPELIIAVGICLVLVLGLISKSNNFRTIQFVFIAACFISIAAACQQWSVNATPVFYGMLRQDNFSNYFRLLADLGGAITLMITPRNRLQKISSEYALLILAVVLGSHLLVMSQNFIMVIISIELISLSSYALTGWSFTRKGSEGSLKYFLFGSVATAVMIYGMSLIFGLTGTLDFTTGTFFNKLIIGPPVIIVGGGVLVLSGFLFKIAAAPMHVWAPDIYEAAPTSVAAFFSIVPKMAGFGVLIKWILALHAYGQSPVNWQLILAIIAIASLAIGNFSALWQSHPKRMMAYSSVAQSGFLLMAVASMSQDGIHILIFYSAVLFLMNLLTFFVIQQFEIDGVVQTEDFAGLGRTGSFRSIALTVGLISLVGLPITAGFTGKLLIFSGLWKAYTDSHQVVLLVLLIFGMFNAVVSLFYYLKIPYFMFLKRPPGTAPAKKNAIAENLFSAILVILILALFFRPDVLMGWIIRTNFVP